MANNLLNYANLNQSFLYLNISVQNPRLYFRVILKLLFTIGVLILFLVFFRSLFVGDLTKSGSVGSKESEQVLVNINNMQEGEIRKARWNGKEVAVLRKANNEYFVYVNTGDSGNCPLFKESNGFKDICTGTRFDFNGRQKVNEEQGFKLETPPNNLENGVLYIGRRAK